MRKEETVNSKKGVDTNKEGFLDETYETHAHAVCPRNVSLEARLTVLQNY